MRTRRKWKNGWILAAACALAALVLMTAPVAARHDVPKPGTPVKPGGERETARSVRIARKDTLKIKGEGKERISCQMRIEISGTSLVARDSLGNRLNGTVVAADETGRRLNLTLDPKSLARFATSLGTTAIGLLPDRVIDEQERMRDERDAAAERLAEAERGRMETYVARHLAGEDPDATAEEKDRLAAAEDEAYAIREEAVEAFRAADLAFQRYQVEVRPAIVVESHTLTARVTRNQRRMTVKGRFELTVASPEWSEAKRAILKISGRGSFVASKRVFLLGDTEAETQVQAALEAAGHEVTFAGIYDEWDGVSPSTEGHDVILFLEGESYGDALMPGASAAILDFVRNGGGLVRTEWGAWSVPYKDEPEPVDELFPAIARPGGDYDYGMRWSVRRGGHPLVFGLPEFWTDEAGFTYLDVHPRAKNAVLGNGAIPMLTWRNDDGGTVVHVNHDMTYETEVVSRQALDLLLNAVEFAGK